MQMFVMWHCIEIILNFKWYLKHLFDYNSWSCEIKFQYYLQIIHLLILFFICLYFPCSVFFLMQLHLLFFYRCLRLAWNNFENYKLLYICYISEYNNQANNTYIQTNTSSTKGVFIWYTQWHSIRENQFFPSSWKCFLG